MMGRDSLPVPAEAAVEETIRMFLLRYRRPQSKREDDAVKSSSRQSAR
jgi:hypothetical protein